MNIIRTLFLILFSLSLLQFLQAAPIQVSFAHSAATVEIFDFVEVSLNVAQPDAANPFTDVTVAGRPARRLMIPQAAVTQNHLDHVGLGRRDERDDLHFAATLWTGQRKSSRDTMPIYRQVGYNAVFPRDGRTAAADDFGRR